MQMTPEIINTNEITIAVTGLFINVFEIIVLFYSTNISELRIILTKTKKISQFFHRFGPFEHFAWGNGQSTRCFLVCQLNYSAPFEPRRTLHAIHYKSH